MSNSYDFLNSYSTNVYILPEFTEIAYIVCKLADTKGAETAGQDPSSEQSLLQLRNAEKQFRKAAILAALDAEKDEVYTFYRKVDVVKDQRAILGKFGQVCRLNSCTIARKSPARMVDLLKPELNRVYQLFTTALLHNVQLQFAGGGKPLAIGTKTYLLPAPDAAIPTTAFDTVPDKFWYLHRIAVQILTGGQVLLTLQHAKSGPLSLLINVLDTSGYINSTAGAKVAYLSPTGQLARFNGSWWGLLSGNRQPTPDDNTQPRSWANMVLTWLKRRGDNILDPDVDHVWIEVEIPLLEATNDTSDASSRVSTWKKVIWPAPLVYVFAHGSPESEPATADGPTLDPLGFARDWYNTCLQHTSLAAGASNLGNADTDHIRDDAMFSDDVSFGDHESAHPFEPPAFPPSQLIYPTPPDGQMTHPTPGVSSVDGMAPTPLQSGQQNYASLDSIPEFEMRDDPSIQQEVGVAEIDDRDLFEDMSDENFGDNENRDEPDWNLFDEPEVGKPPSAQVVGADLPHNHSIPLDGEVKSTSQLNDEFQQDSHIPTATLQTGTAMDNSDEGKSRPQDMGLDQAHLDHMFPPAQEKVIFESQHEHSDLTPQFTDNVHLASRRSSIYETTGVKPLVDDHDLKYKSHGKYWFDPLTAANLKRKSTDGGTTPARPATSDSDTSMSSTDSDDSDRFTFTKQKLGKVTQTWTEYKPEAGEAATSDQVSPNNTDSSSEASAILRMIASAGSDEPFLYDVTQARPCDFIPLYDEDEETLATVAQTMVDQLSQSSVLRNIEGLRIDQGDQWSDIELSIDHSEARKPLPNALLGELISIQLGPTVISQDERLQSLPRPFVVVRRGDEPIQAETTILRFWDTLGLQPVFGPKDVTSFCLYPMESHIDETCSAFLARIADTYSGCNFGAHSQGTISGLTTDGLIPWRNGIAGIKDFCTKTGIAMASSPDIVGTIVVYIVCSSTSLLHCREISHAFTLLFESFARESSETHPEVELVLQLIPLSFIASPDLVVIQERERYLELAIEVYNRIPGQLDGSVPAACASAVVLDKPQPKRIEFDLSSAITNPMSKEGAFLHLAYSCSMDGKWLVAAWSDEDGRRALTMSYLLRGRDNESRPRRDVLRDMWEISHDIMSQESQRWRLCIVKTGFFLLEELNEWLQLVNQSNQDRTASAKIILVSVNPDTAIKFRHKDAVGRLPSLLVPTSGVHNSASTPATTPQNNTNVAGTTATSPDQSIPATPTPGGLSHNPPSTPPEHLLDVALDGESIIVDPREDSWSAVLGFGANQSDDFSTIRAAGASGVLLKRAPDTQDTGRVVSIEVHILATSRMTTVSPTQQERELILQDVLGQFRRLVALAATRGCVDRDRDCIPWHIATVIKGARVLGQVM